MQNKALDYSINRLYQVYKIYHEVSAPYMSEKESKLAARQATDEYVEYCKEAANDFHWDSLPAAIENHIRILAGLIECYEKVVVKEKVIEKTRRGL